MSGKTLKALEFKASRFHLRRVFKIIDKIFEKKIAARLARTNADKFVNKIRIIGLNPRLKIFLLHANSINADYFDAVAAILKKRSYDFITLEEALKDEAYKSLDTFTGPAGITWLHRWAITRGKDNILPNEPDTPEWIIKESGLTFE